MSRGPVDLDDVEPFTIATETTPDGGQYVRVETTLHPSLSAEGDANLAHERYLFDNPDEHVHPNQREVVEVLAGEARVAVDGNEERLDEGESTTLPSATPHRHWNPTNEPVRLAFEQHPAQRSAALLETFWALAQDGRTDEKGLPNMLHLAVLADEYPGHFYSAEMPVWLQRTVLPLVAPIGRLAGYEARHSSADVSVTD